MGSFSWTKADTLTKVRNIQEDKPFKFLIPQEFGGGFIRDTYQGYGYLGRKPNGDPKYDMYELLAFWNAGTSGIADRLMFDEDKTCIMKEIDQYTMKNRNLGIDLGCYPNQVDNLRYPLKLVSASYRGTYEDCVGVSYSDPNQGWGPLSENDLPSWLEAKFEIWKGEEKRLQEVNLPKYADARDGDIYLNPFFGDLWIVQDNKFIKINNGYFTDISDPEGFIKVGHVNEVISTDRTHHMKESTHAS